MLLLFVLTLPSTSFDVLLNGSKTCYILTDMLHTVSILKVYQIFPVDQKIFIATPMYQTALCWIVWHNVHSQQHIYMSSSYRSSRLGLSHWDPYAMHRGGWLELYYCNMVEWSWWDSSLISKTNWFPSVLWHCWFGHMTCKNRPRYDL